MHALLVRRGGVVALVLGLLLPTVLCGETVLRGENVDPAKLLPDTCVAYAHINSPAKLLATVLDHPLRDEFEQTPLYDQIRRDEGYRNMQLGLRLVEFKLGKLWRPAVESLTKGGITVAFDPRSEGAVLLVRSGDEQFLHKVRDTLLEFVRGEAEKNGQDDPVEQIDYRGVTAYHVNEIGFATHGQWLVVTNKGELGKSVLDRLLGDDKPNLTSNSAFAKARDHVTDDPTAWAFVDLNTIRDSGLAEDLFRGHAEEFGGEMILGGALVALENAQYASISLAATTGALRISTAIPAQPEQLADEASYFFGPEGDASVAPRIELDGRIASLRAYRNLAELWLRAPDLFGDQANADLAKAESDLSTLAGGRSFSEEILGALGPHVQIVAAEQNYDRANVPTPEIKLPGFAIVFTIRDPAQSQRLLKIAYQQVVGFFNLTAGQQGYPPLELNSTRESGVTYVSATYLREDLERYIQDSPDDGAARLQANFSPTAAFVGEYFVLSSTNELAHDLVAQLRNTDNGTAAPSSNEKSVNTDLLVQAKPLLAVLTANREHLVNQNMLEEGNDREAAERETDGLLTILDWLDTGRLELALENETLKLTAELLLRK